MIEVNSIQSQKDLERYARTAEGLEVRSEHSGKKHFLTGPVDSKGNVFWPDAVLVSTAIIKMSDIVRVSGKRLRITFENGHGEYIILGELDSMKYVVGTKISSSIEHPLLVVEDPNGKLSAC